MAVILTFAVLVTLSLVFEMVRRQNPAETLFTSSAPRQANLYFKIQNPAGRSQDFVRLTGNGYLLLYVWNTECAACLEEMTQLNAMTTQISNRQLRVVPVATDAAASDVINFIRRNQLNGLRAYRIDARFSALEALGIQRVPARYLIDPKGKILGVADRPVPWSDPRVVDTLRMNTQSVLASVR